MLPGHPGVWAQIEIRAEREVGGRWSLFLSPPTLRGAEESEFTLRTMRDWKGDAIIAASNDRAELAAARKWGIPIVNLAAGLSKFPGIPRVMVDHFQAGGLAAEHLLKRGLRHLAYFGWKDVWYSDQRRLGFMERAPGLASPARFSSAPPRMRPTRHGASGS
jgi:LacI family transcriptional regulator